MKEIKILKDFSDLGLLTQVTLYYYYIFNQIIKALMSTVSLQNSLPLK